MTNVTDVSTARDVFFKTLFKRSQSFSESNAKEAPAVSSSESVKSDESSESDKSDKSLTSAFFASETDAPSPPPSSSLDLDLLTPLLETTTATPSCRLVIRCVESK
jgi:hypothetical protein